MTSDNDIKHLIRSKALELGFEACGFAKAKEVNKFAIDQYSQWIAEGKNDCMEYAERYCDLRNNPCILFPGAKTVICLAMNYYPAIHQPKEAPQFSMYAYGKDYHDVVRNRLKSLSLFIQENWNAESRICVDTAPIMEKYWAREAGIGFIGRNQLLIIPGKGSFFFLGELITTLEITPDKPCNLTCGDCNACVNSCPSGALTNNNSLDARKCLSCQLIERHGDLPQWVREKAENRVYGCDTCQLCCPHNAKAQPTAIPEFSPSEQFLNLTLNDITEISDDRFREIFSKSAVKRTKAEGLRRNASIIDANINKKI